MEEQKIVPAYMKKNDKSAENEKKVKSSNIKKNNTKKIVISIIAVIALVAIIFGVIFLMRVIKYSKYNDYSFQIEKYGLNIMYDNGKATSYESASRAEALKIIISSIENILNIDLTKHEETYKNEDFVNYAINNKIVGSSEINKSNANEQITYIEFVTYYMNALNKLKKINLDTTVYPNFSDAKLLEGERLYAVSNLVSKGIIENTNKKLDPNRKLYKGELNKIACDIIKAYDLIVPTGEKFNINEEKTPSNAAKYSYILYNVDKEAYEKDLMVRNKEKFIEPYKTFAELRIGLDSTINNVNQYYNAILNVDYENINLTDFKAKLGNSLLFDADDEDILKYIKYVEDNKIKISGTAKAQMPVVYNDGLYYRMRVKIEFKILNSDTTKNLFFADNSNETNDIEYKNKDYSFYIDAVISKLSNRGTTLYVWDKDMYSTKIDENIEGIELTEKTDPIKDIDVDSSQENLEEKEILGEDDISMD